MHAELQSYHTFDSTSVACYSRLSALSQRRAADASEASLHTLGLLVLALQVQGGAAPVESGSRVLIDIVTKATVINQAVLAILIVISVASWAIILSKSLAYSKVAKQTSQFLEAFRKSSKFSEVQAVCSTLPASPLVGVFQAGYAELNAQFRLSAPQAANPSGPPPRPTLKSLTAVDRALLRFWRPWPAWRRSSGCLEQLLESPSLFSASAPPARRIWQWSDRASRRR